MVKEKFKKHIFLTMTILLITIFITGILVGRVSSSKKLNEVNKFIKENELNTESYLIEQQLIGDLSEENCGLAKIRLDELFDQLSYIGGKLVAEDIKKQIGEDNYEFLKRKYHLLQIRTYTLFKKLSDNCDIEPKVVLYYYSPNQEDSRYQGLILDELVKNYQFNVFALEFNYSSETNFLEQHYNIIKTPAIIVNYDYKFEGLTKYDKLANQFV